MVIQSPTFERTIVENRAGMRCSCADLFCGIRAEVDNGQIGAHLARLITTLSHIAIPELASPISPPALDITIGLNGAGMIPTGSNL